MKLGCTSLVAVLATAIAAGLGYFSFWWIAIPSFLAGSLSLSNGPHYDQVMRANEEGRFYFFPLMLTLSILPFLAFAGIVYWITTKLISN